MQNMTSHRIDTAGALITTMAKRRSQTPSSQDNGGDRLLTILQVTNSAFPTGAFTHSYGFETWVDNGVIGDAREAEIRCFDWLRFGVATGDAAAVALTYRSVVHGNMGALAEIDRQVGAIKLSRESRDASIMMGASLIAAGRDIFASPQIGALAAMVQNGECEGHHAVAYGALSAGLGFSEQQAVASFLWTALSGLVGVVQRLVPLGQAEAQRIIAGAGRLIDDCSEIARTRELDAISTSFAALDVASMRHERLSARLCIS